MLSRTLFPSLCLAAVAALAPGVAPAHAAVANPNSAVLRQRLQETEDTLARLQEARKTARETLAVYIDPNTVLIRVPFSPERPGGVKGLTRAINEAMYVPVKVQDLTEMLTTRVLLAELTREKDPPGDLRARVATKVARVLNLLKTRSARTRGSIERGIADLDVEIAREEKKRARLAEQVRQEDLRVAGKPTGAIELEGVWRRDDGHEVTFRKTADGYSGVATKLTASLRDDHFSEGEETFKLRRAGLTTFTGQVKWRYESGESEWRPVTVTLRSGESMTDSSTGNWRRVK
jgi:hypothetical protein